MRHGVDDVVHADADAERGVPGRIGGSVGPFPGISHIRLIGDGDHQAAAVIVDAAPLIRTRIALEGYTTVHRSLARYLVTLVQVINHVKNGGFIGEIDDGPVGEDALHALQKYFPFVFAPEIVAHEEAAAEKVLPKSRGLTVTQIPVADLHGVDPWPVVNIALVQIDGLLHRAGVQAREPSHGQYEVAVGARIIL